MVRFETVMYTTVESLFLGGFRKRDVQRELCQRYTENDDLRVKIEQSLISHMNFFGYSMDFIDMILDELSKMSPSKLAKYTTCDFKNAVIDIDAYKDANPSCVIIRVPCTFDDAAALNFHA